MYNNDWYNSVSRTDLINELISHNDYKSYLEIGVNNGENFRYIKCDEKVGVDPEYHTMATIFMTSDDYFAHVDDDKKFDIIFIDGLHEHKQCYRDIVNSIRHLSKNGTIVCHDMNPLFESWLKRRGYGMLWTGDVYKAFVETRINRCDVECTLLYDTDYGCGIIRHHNFIHPDLNWDMNDLSYTVWSENKNYLMNTMTYDTFKKNFLECEYFMHSFNEFTR